MPIKELPIEVIGNYTPEAPVEPQKPLEQEEVKKVPEDAPTPMPEEMEALKAELNKDIDTFLVKVSALKQGENKVVESLKNKHSERDEKDKVEKETRKNTDKETKGKHKEELKSRDTEIKDLKKIISQKEKEIAKLHKQVKDALYSEENG